MDSAKQIVVKTMTPEKRAIAIITVLLLPLSDRLSFSAESLFGGENLHAWCIVPYDGKQRTPEQRAAMLARLGIRRFAYDWRSEHIGTFEEEILALKRHGIEITAFISPNESAFKLMEKYNLKPHIWCVFSSAPPDVTDHDQRVKFAVDSILPVVERTRKIGCQLGLYAHSGWSGHPDNMVAVAAKLRNEHAAAHVGIVYNFHWAHTVLERFPEAMAMMNPYLIALNLNGMTHNGPALGKMILPLGQGELDITLLRQAHTD